MLQHSVALNLFFTRDLKFIIRCWKLFLACGVQGDVNRPGDSVAMSAWSLMDVVP